MGEPDVPEGMTFGSQQSAGYDALDLASILPSGEIVYPEYFIDHPAGARAENVSLLVGMEQDIVRNTDSTNTWLDVGPNSLEPETVSFAVRYLSGEQWNALYEEYWRRESSIEARNRMLVNREHDAVLARYRRLTTRPRPMVRWDPERPEYYYSAYGENTNTRAATMYRWATGIVRISKNRWILESQRTWNIKYTVVRNLVRTMANGNVLYRYRCSCPQYARFPANQCKHIVYTRNMLYRSKGYRPARNVAPRRT